METVLIGRRWRIVPGRAAQLNETEVCAGAVIAAVNAQSVQSTPTFYPKKLLGAVVWPVAA
jgi:hypothetical protein